MSTESVPPAGRGTVLCVFGEHAYGDPRRGESYEHASFLPAWRRLGYAVERLESFDRTAYTGFADLNRAFLATIERVQPVLVFCVLMHYELWLETLALARTVSNAPLVNWSTDDSWKYEQFSRLVAPAFDLYATTSARALRCAQRAGIGSMMLSQWAASAEKLAEPLPAATCRYPVSFVGAAYGNRPRWIAALRARGIEVACFGHGWPSGPIATADVARVMRESVISLNFGDSGRILQGGRLTHSRQIKARVFEVPGAGGFLLTEPADELERYYTPGREIATFADADELAARIRHFLAHPDERDRIALAGHLRTRAEHTWETRLSEVARLALERAAQRQTAPVARTVDRDLDELSRDHRITPLLRFVRWLLVVPLVAVFGGRRGPRAARRILFELSWRVAGRHTYRARGWPGRLFYEDS